MKIVLEGYVAVVNITEGNEIWYYDCDITLAPDGNRTMHIVAEFPRTEIKVKQPGLHRIEFRNSSGELIHFKDAFWCRRGDTVTIRP